MSRFPKNEPATRRAPAAWRLPALALAAVAIASVIPYLPVASGDFVQDDHSIVEQNPVVRHGGIAAIFGTDYWSGGAPGGASGLYRPVTILSFAIERGADGGVNPAGAHRVNIFLHALTSLLLVLLARRVGASWPAATAAGLLFAVHPVHAGAVSGLVGRAEVLAALFTLGALLAHTAAGPWCGARRPGVELAAPWLSALLVFLALGSKETAIAAPFLMLSMDALFRSPERGLAGSWWRARIQALAPTALAVVAFVALRGRVLGSVLAVQKPMQSDNPLVVLHGAERIGTAFGLAARAAGLLAYPARLTPDYSGTTIPKESGPWAPLSVAGILFLAALAAIALIPLWSRATRALSSPVLGPPLRRAAFAATLFLLPYLVVGNLLVTIGVIFAERLLYLPSIGFCLLVPSLAESALAARRSRGPLPLPLAATLVALLALATVGGAVRTALASAEWRSDERLWEAAARSTPESPRAQFTLGKIRADQGRDAEAYDLFDRATSLWPYFSSAWYEKGVILARRGDLPRAEEALRKAAEQNPRSDRFAEALGNLFFDAGRFREAADAYRRAVALGRSDLAAREREARARSAGP